MHRREITAGVRMGKGRTGRRPPARRQPNRVKVSHPAERRNLSHPVRRLRDRSVLAHASRPSGARRPACGQFREQYSLNGAPDNASSGSCARSNAGRRGRRGLRREAARPKPLGSGASRKPLGSGASKMRSSAYSSCRNNPGAVALAAASGVNCAGSNAHNEASNSGNAGPCAIKNGCNSCSSRPNRTG